MRLIVMALAASLMSACATAAPLPEVVRATEADADGVIRVLVDTLGRPTNIEIVRSTNDQKTDKAVLRAARSWKFTPQIVGGKPQPTWHVVPVRVTSP